MPNTNSKLATWLGKRFQRLADPSKGLQHVFKVVFAHTTLGQPHNFASHPESCGCTTFPATLFFLPRSWLSGAWPITTPVTSATAQGFMKKSLENPRAKTTSDVSSAIQMLEELVWNYEEHRDKKYDNYLKWQMLYDILPKPIEQQLVLEDRDGPATKSKRLDFDDSTGRADMDLETMENGGNDEDDDGGRDRDPSGDLMGLKGGKGKTRKGTVQWILPPVWAVGTHGNSWLEKGKRKQGKEESKGQNKGKGKGKIGKGWRWNQKGTEKGQVFQGMSEWDEWVQTGEHTSVPILSRTRTARNRIIRSDDDVRGVASSDEASEVEVQQNQRRQSTVHVQQEVRGHHKRRQEKTREDKRRQEKTREDKRRQEKTREDKRRQEKTREDKRRQEKTREDKRRQEKTREDKRRQEKTREDKRRQEKTGEDRTGQDRTGQDRTGQDRTGQDRTGQDRTGQDRTGQDRTGQDRTGQDRTGQDRTRQDKTRQDKTRQDKTRQDKTGAQ